LSFASTIHDRVYLMNDQFEKFNISVEGEAMVLAQASIGRVALRWIRTWAASSDAFLEPAAKTACAFVAMYEENARRSAASSPHQSKSGPDIRVARQIRCHAAHPRSVWSRAAAGRAG